MALATAVGPVSLNEDLIANTLADSPKFQAFLGVASKAAALAKIYFGSLDSPAAGADFHTAAELIALRPYAILWTDESAGLTCDFSAMGGTGYEMRVTRGLVIVRLEKAAASGSPQEADRSVKNELGLIVKSGDHDNPGLAELSGRPGYAAVRRITIRGPWRCDEDEAQHYGDHVAARLDLEFGAVER